MSGAPFCAGEGANSAAWLVDRLLPEASYRQWLLTFPWTMRFRLAADRHLLGEVLRVFLQVLFAWQRRRGRELGIRHGQTGAVTFVQRFGGALNLNPHLHSVEPDGLFVPEPDGSLRLVPLPPPTTAEVQDLAVAIASRLTERLAAASEEEGNYLDPDLAALCEALLWSRNAPAGTCDLPRLDGMGEEGREEEGLRGKPLCASVAPLRGHGGFSLHAAQSVPAHDRRRDSRRRWSCRPDPGRPLGRRVRARQLTAP